VGRLTVGNTALVLLELPLRLILGSGPKMWARSKFCTKIYLIGAAFGEMSYWLDIIELEDEVRSSTGLK
jgi:hypothetical protein